MTLHGVHPHRSDKKMLSGAAQHGSWVQISTTGVNGASEQNLVCLRGEWHADDNDPSKSLQLVVVVEIYSGMLRSATRLGELDWPSEEARGQGRGAPVSSLMHHICITYGASPPVLGQSGRGSVRALAPSQPARLDRCARLPSSTSPRPAAFRRCCPKNVAGVKTAL